MRHLFLFLICLHLAQAAELRLIKASSPLEGLLVRDQALLYLQGLEEPAKDFNYELRLELEHQEKRMFNYVLELYKRNEFLGRQTGILDFEEFRFGFGRALETILTAPPDVRVVSLDEFQGSAAQETELKRLLVEAMEATDQILVLESADFAHHHLSVKLVQPSADRKVLEIFLDGKALGKTIVQGQDLWEPALSIASMVLGQRHERVRLALFESGSAGGLKPLQRGPMDYVLESDPKIRQSFFDGEAYPVLLKSGEKIKILRFGYQPKIVQVRPESKNIKQVILVPDLVESSVHILAPGHRLGPVRLTGYEGEMHEIEDNASLLLKRGYKYRYSMEVNQRGQWQLLSGWFIVPEQGLFLELFDENFPDNLELNLEAKP